ncbi:MAG: hypothetical protein ACFFCQ_02165, partial [Promethearchaeota archaeon]
RIAIQGVSNMAQKQRIKASFVVPSPSFPRIYLEHYLCYIFPPNAFSPYYLLGLLNSTLLNAYLQVLSANNNITPHEIARLPIIMPNNSFKEEIKRISELAESTTKKKKLFYKQHGNTRSYLNEHDQVTLNNKKNELDRCINQMFCLSEEESKFLTKNGRM